MCIVLAGMSPIIMEMRILFSAGQTKQFLETIAKFLNYALGHCMPL